MPLITNFLVISILILTVFVKMVPAPDFDYDVVLKELKNMYKTEILQFCEKKKIQTNDDDDYIMSAVTLSYVKDLLNDYNRYYRKLSYNLDDLIKFLAMMSKMQDSATFIDQPGELEMELKEYIEENGENERKIYKFATFCSLPKEIEESFYFAQFRFLYSNYVAKHHNVEINEEDQSRIDEEISTRIEEYNTSGVNKKTNNHSEIGDDSSLNENYFKFNRTTYLEFIPLYIEELHLYDNVAFPENEVPTNFSVSIEENFDKTENSQKKAATNYINSNYIQFLDIWQYYEFDSYVFYKFLILDKNQIDDSEFHTILPKFLHIFKESMDNCYKVLISMNISTLSENQQNVYYKQMLRAMINIYNSYDAPETRKTITEFVQQMIDVATDIEQKSKTKIDETIEEIIYECVDLNCSLPYNVNFKDILNYLIVQKLKRVSIDHKSISRNCADLN